jgi:hypothetical protein
LRLAPTSLISILASTPCPGEGLGDAVGLGEGLGEGLGDAVGLGEAVGLGDGLAVGLGLGVAVGLGDGVGVCHAPTVEVFKTKRVRRSMIAPAPPCKFIAGILLFRKLIDLSLQLKKIAPLMRLS